MTAHAQLSPSSAVRWLSCPASVIAVRDSGIPDKPSVYAAEGRHAHEIAEIVAAHRLGMISDYEYQKRRSDWESRWDDQWGDTVDQSMMLDHARSYADLLAAYAAELPQSLVMLELSMSTGIPGCWGTADAVIVSPSRFVVVDYKYGKGVAVRPAGNPQPMLYALGALEQFADVYDPHDVTMVIFQPRVSDGTPAEAEISTDDLRTWRRQISPIAEQALEPGAPFGPSVDACRFCPISGQCRAQRDHALATDFGSPEIMSADEIAESLGRVAEIRQWLDALEKVALDKTYSRGESLPGWKVVRSGGRRKINDPDAAIERLVAAGHDRERVSSTKIAGLGELDKITGGKDSLAELLGDLLGQTEGRPALVPESDPRDSVSPTSDAQQTFSVVRDD